MDSEFEGAAAQTAIIAQECNVEIKFQMPILPKFPTPNQQSAADYLKQLCLAGLKKRPLAAGYSPTDYEKRLQRELTTIHEMGFDDYFLIVWDVMRFAHKKSWRLIQGVGRQLAR